MELADDAERKTVKNFLNGGDAEVLIWEKLWAKHKKAPGVLTYDLLQTPHHCSWHSISNDSRSDLGDKAKVSPDAKAALSQIRKEGRIVASSSSIKDDDCDPPCHAAKVEYEAITKGASGKFLCTGSHPTESKEASLLADADLIICATADWEMESLLNLQHTCGEIVAPVLYTWTEPHACAGHAVFLPSTTPCLQCGMTLQGEARLAITAWPKGTETRSEPACGEVFQPYGPIELQGTISSAASLALDGLLGKAQYALHRVWAGAHSLVVEAGGDWSDTWRNGHPEREKGGMQENWTWEKDDLCLVCSGSVTGAASHSELGTQASVYFSPPPSSTI